MSVLVTPHPHRPLVQSAASAVAALVDVGW